MKKQLLTVALLLSANTVVQASEMYPDGHSEGPAIMGGAVAADTPERPYIVSTPSNPVPKPENPSEGTIYQQSYEGGAYVQYCYKGGKWVYENGWHGLQVRPTQKPGIPKKISENLYAVTPRNFESERAQHEELVRNVREILKIVTELRNRK
jgi:hypothetical protein